MYAEIALDVPLRTCFTYKIPTQWEGRISRGLKVLVPFGKQKKVGICLKVVNEPEASIDQKKIREIFAVYPNPFLSETYLKWLEFAADYYFTPIGQVFYQALPKPYFITDEFSEFKERRARAIKISDDFVRNQVVLNAAQTEVVKDVSRHLGEFYPCLLHGVTGSGKTEVYIEIIKNVLKEGKSALFLVPEIGLTPQTLSRLNYHFRDDLLLYHSGLTDNQRFVQWQLALEDKPKVMVGTRSALFTPFSRLGVVIIDEEHDGSYKQEDRFRYHGRDLAVVRASLEKCPVILGSATPSLESYHLGKTGKYKYFELKARATGGGLPRIEVVDQKKEKEQSDLARQLSRHFHQAIEKHYKNQEQMILFVGQRGYAQNAYCMHCGEAQTCLNCDVGLKYHGVSQTLKCHYCSYEEKFDEVCRSCHEKSLTLLGIGIQGIEDEIKSFYPNMRFVRVDSDSFPSPKKLGQVFTDFSKHKYDMLIGTQMLAKGHDFPNIGFVGILGIDAHLGLPDFRSAERAFQNLVQVAGRAGRDKKQGLVLVQSFMPEHMSIKSGVKQDYHGFAKGELERRMELNYPPFCRLVEIKFISNREDRLKNFVGAFSKKIFQVKGLLEEKGVHVLGPVQMSIYKLRNKFRYHLILKVPRELKGKQVLDYFVKELGLVDDNGVQVQFDVDPMSLM